MTERPADFAAYCEIHDASDLVSDFRAAPLAMVLEVAQILVAFDTQIDDEWRARLIFMAGALMRLDREFNLSGD